MVEPNTVPYDQRQQVMANVFESMKDLKDWLNEFVDPIEPDEDGPGSYDHIDHFQIVPNNGYFHIVVVYHEVSLVKDQSEQPA